MLYYICFPREQERIKGERLADIIFKTSLSEEEMMKNFENVDILEELMQSLNDISAYEQGKFVEGIIISKRSTDEN